MMKTIIAPSIRILVSSRQKPCISWLLMPIMQAKRVPTRAAITENITRKLLWKRLMR